MIESRRIWRKDRLRHLEQTSGGLQMSILSRACLAQLTTELKCRRLRLTPNANSSLSKQGRRHRLRGLWADADKPTVALPPFLRTLSVSFSSAIWLQGDRQRLTPKINHLARTAHSWLKNCGLLEARKDVTAQTRSSTKIWFQGHLLSSLKQWQGTTSLDKSQSTWFLKSHHANRFAVQIPPQTFLFWLMPN